MVKKKQAVQTITLLSPCRGDGAMHTGVLHPSNAEATFFQSIMALTF